MSLLWLLLIGVGEAMDCVAVSLVLGLAHPNLGARKAYPIAVFGGFQMGMTLAGWLAGQLAWGWIESFADTAAFGLLALIGGHMLYESFHDEEGEAANPVKEPRTSRWDPMRPITLLALGLATSIDSLGVGFSLRMMHAGLFFSSAVIGVVTAALSWAAFALAGRIASGWSGRFERFGGVILILIGLKIILVK